MNPTKNPEGDSGDPEGLARCNKKKNHINSGKIDTPNEYIHEILLSV
jgi:hypothetical protein